MIAMIVYRIPLRVYYQRTHINVVFLMWVTALGLLILTAMFGDVINGSRRWLDLGIFNLQAGEVAKAVMVFVTADYVVRRSAELRSNVFTGCVYWHGIYQWADCCYFNQILVLSWYYLPL